MLPWHRRNLASNPSPLSLTCVSATVSLANGKRPYSCSQKGRVGRPPTGATRAKLGASPPPGGLAVPLSPPPPSLLGGGNAAPTCQISETTTLPLQFTWWRIDLGEKLSHPTQALDFVSVDRITRFRPFYREVMSLDAWLTPYLRWLDVAYVYLLGLVLTNILQIWLYVVR